MGNRASNGGLAGRRLGHAPLVRIHQGGLPRLAGLHHRSAVDFTLSQQSESQNQAELQGESITESIKTLLCRLGDEVALRGVRGLHDAVRRLDHLLRTRVLRLQGE